DDPDGLHGRGGAGRARAAGRAGGLEPQRRLEPRAGRARVGAGPLPGHGGAAHRVPRRDAGRGLRAPPGGPPGPRLEHARRRRRGPGPALVVHPHPRAPLEHPRDHRAGAGAGALGPLPAPLPPQLRRGGGGGRRTAPGARGVDHRAGLHRRQRRPADGADPGREPGTRLAAPARLEARRCV
ncbi:MAG: FIG01130075: hypothetical protein, partial [uncultured Nocardioides sp.]